MRPLTLLILALAAALAADHLGAQAPEGDRPLTGSELGASAERIHALLAAEDRRARDPADLEALLAALDDEEPVVRRVAARAIGRLERGELAPALEPLTADPDPRVRAEAANALAQALRGASPPERSAGHTLLIERLGQESDPHAAGSLGRSLARIPLAGAGELGERERALLALPAPALGRAAFALYRAAASARLPAGDELPARLEAIALGTEGGAGELPDHARRNAAAARLAAGNVPAALIEELLDASDPETRRHAAAAIRTLPEAEARPELAARALADPVDRVRIEGVRAAGCNEVLAATRDDSDHVALLAIDALAGRCFEAEGALERLADLAGGASPTPGAAWHRPVRALAGLARRDPGQAAPLLEGVFEHEIPFVRAHGARIASTLGDTEALRRLAADPDPNVRAAAVTGLAALEVERADDALLDQLGQSDPGLLRTTANLMSDWHERMAPGSPEAARSVEALLGALTRLTEVGGATSRDARIPLVRRIGELGSAEDHAALEGWRNDPDPVIRAEVARALGEPVPEGAQAGKAGFEELPFPPLEELRALEGVRVELEFEGLGSVVVAVLPFEAPTNAARFVRMAREGTFEGLMLHRVVPNFVLQGGSPGANEYAGHGAYTRDELGLVGHWRGTLGISTRGRDTGDGQIFVNLVDNLRLDHDYTVFGVVVEGMEVADRIQEGAVMTRVRVR